MTQSPDIIYELIAQIQDRHQVSEELCVSAISKLGTLLADCDDPDEDYPMACAVLQDLIANETNTRLVTHTVSVLGRVGVKRFAPLLIDVLLGSQIQLYECQTARQFMASDDSMRLRSAAAYALGKVGDQRAIIPLMSILNDRTQNYRLRLAAAESLGKLGDDYAVKPLIDILSDEREKSIYLKESVAKALGMLGDIRAIEPLIDVLESKRGIRDKFNFLKEQIIEAIGRIGKPDSRTATSLVKALKDEAPSIRMAALDALSVLGDASCLPSIQSCIFDPEDDVAKAAINAVYRIGGEPLIRELLAHDSLPRFLRDELEGYIP